MGYKVGNIENMLKEFLRYCSCFLEKTPRYLILIENKMLQNARQQNLTGLYMLISH